MSGYANSDNEDQPLSNDDTIPLCYILDLDAQRPKETKPGDLIIRTSGNRIVFAFVYPYAVVKVVETLSAKSPCKHCVKHISLNDDDTAVVASIAPQYRYDLFIPFYRQNRHTTDPEAEIELHNIEHHYANLLHNPASNSLCVALWFEVPSHQRGLYVSKLVQRSALCVYESYLDPHHILILYRIMDNGDWVFEALPPSRGMTKAQLRDESNKAYAKALVPVGHMMLMMSQDRAVPEAIARTMQGGWKMKKLSDTCATFEGPNKSRESQARIIDSQIREGTCRLIRLPADRRVNDNDNSLDWEPLAKMRWPYAQQQMRDIAIVFYGIGLPIYPLLWILEWLKDFMRWPEYKKMRTIDCMYWSMNRVIKQRDNGRKEIKSES